MFPEPFRLVLADGRRVHELTRFDRVALSYAAHVPYRELACTLTDDAHGATLAAVYPEHQVTAYAGPDLILAGFTEYAEASFDSGAHKVEMRARSKGHALHDHAATHPTREFRDQTILQIARTLTPPGVVVTADVPLKPVGLFRLNPGETVADALGRLANKQHLQLMSLPDGSVRITEGGSAVAHMHVLTDHGPRANIVKGAAVFDASARKSAYHVIGQRTLGRVGAATIRVTASAHHPRIVRTKEAHIHADSDVGADEADTLAQAHRDRQHGASTEATVICRGWRDDAGLLWKANTQVAVDCDRLQLHRSMLIKQVALSADRAGSSAALTLVDPAALKKGVRSKDTSRYAADKK
jgi:prophage tail gpP-like protein